MDGLAPSPTLEKTLKIIHFVFAQAHVNYWLAFGGLWGLVKNNGVIPDEDLDLCTYYGNPYKKIRRLFEGKGYVFFKGLQDDTCPENLVYCGFNHATLPHLCLSFWVEKTVHVPWEGRDVRLRFYCHDQYHEVKGLGVPAHGYFFKGIPSEYLEPFVRVEWPGIIQNVKVRVPALPGRILDFSYPAWAYVKQRYNIEANEYDPERVKSLFSGGAISPYMVHVDSMADFQNPAKMAQELENGHEKWLARLKLLGVRS